MIVNQISVFVENKAGQLAELTDVLARNHISMRALSIADTRDYGILRILVEDPEKAALVLKEAGWVCTITPVLAVGIADEPGALEKILNILAKQSINLEYLYAFLSPKNDSAGVVLRVEDNERAARALAEGGIALSEQNIFDRN